MDPLVEGRTTHAELECDVVDAPVVTLERLHEDPALEGTSLRAEAPTAAQQSRRCVREGSRQEVDGSAIDCARRHVDVERANHIVARDGDATEGADVCAAEALDLRELRIRCDVVDREGAAPNEYALDNDRRCSETGIPPRGIARVKASELPAEAFELDPDGVGVHEGERGVEAPIVGCEG